MRLLIILFMAAIPFFSRSYLIFLFLVTLFLIRLKFDLREGLIISLSFALPLCSLLAEGVIAEVRLGCLRKPKGTQAF